MSRSLFAKLSRRFGQRITGEEHRRRAEEHHARLREAMPVDLVGGSRLAANRAARLAVLGAGFSGLSAAWFASRAGMSVTLIEPRGPGGRVSSRHDFIEGRILEAGGELIGTNHPMWLAFARHFGLGLSVITTEDNYGAAGLSMPMILSGRHLTDAEQKSLYEEMDTVFRAWAKESEIVTAPWKPWTTPGAAALDGETLDQHIPATISDLTKEAIRTDFEMNNTLAASQQSWLGNLAQFAGGGGYSYFEDSEVFRCAAGNQALAKNLAAKLNVDKHRATNIRLSGQRIFIDLDGGEREGPFDYVVVAVPAVSMEKLTIDGKPFPYRAIGHGPAVKYFSAFERRSWIADGLAPSSLSDQLGMTWEGTDNQMDTAPFDLTVFTSSHLAQEAIEAGGGPAYFTPRLQQLYPHYKPLRTELQNWPRRIGMGYSCPRPGEVTTIQKSYADLIDGRIAVAGEHTSPAWFGYMEGALQSGLVAAVRIAQQAGITIPREFGSFRAI